MGERPVVHSDSDGPTTRFVNAVLSRPSPFTIVFIAFCVVVYLLMRFTGGADGPSLVAFGASLNSRIQEGEWWRFVTPIFLHVPMGALPLHLLVNMWALWSFGPYVEKLYGSSKFVVIWVVTGVAGNVASYLAVRPNMHPGTIASFLIKTTDVPSAGASGALFGLVGVLLVFGIKYRRELPEGFKRVFGTGLLPIILINFGIGFLGRGFIGNAAHVGGLFAGIGLALVVDYERPGSTPMRQMVWRILQIAALVLIVVSYFMLSRHFTPPPTQEAVSAYMVSINQGKRAVEAYLSKKDPTKDAADLEKAEHDLAAVQHISPRADDLVAQLRILIQRCQQLNSVDDKAKPAAVEASRAGLEKDYDALDEKLTQWVTTEGVVYGLVLEKPDDKSGKPAT